MVLRSAHSASGRFAEGVLVSTHPIRVAIVGVGNCASSLVQGVEFYQDAADNADVPGLMHVRFGDYHVRDVQVVTAFDVDAEKVGQDLAVAINASQNNTLKFCDVPATGVLVQRGPTLDGLGRYYRETITESDATPSIGPLLKAAEVDVMVLSPVGSSGRQFYAQCAIDAGCAFVNALRFHRRYAGVGTEIRRCRAPDRWR